MSEDKVYTQEFLTYLQEEYDIAPEEVEYVDDETMDSIVDAYQNPPDEHECTPAPVRLGGHSIYCKECNALMEQ